MSVRRHRATIKERRNEVEEELLRLLEHAVAKSNIPLAADQLPTSLDEVGSKARTSSTMAPLEHELAEMTRQRNQAISRCLQIERENEELNERLHKTSGVMQAYRSLKKDYAALQLSLNSSEAIRVKQKELISLLRRGRFAEDLSSNSLVSLMRQPAEH